MNSDRLTYSNIVYLHHFNAKLQSKMKKAPSQEIDHAIVPIETIVRKISLIRGKKSCSIPTSPTSTKWKPKT